MRCKRPTSARRGTFSRTSVSSVRRLAIIKGSVAFLAPEIGMLPLSLRPPAMRMRSMPPILRWKTRTSAGLGVVLRRDSGGIVRLRGFAGLACGGRTRFALRLAAFEIFPQRRRQPLLAAGFCRGLILHAIHQGPADDKQTSRTHLNAPAKAA